MNPYGKNEPKGPTIKLADLLNSAAAKTLPDCDHCRNGQKDLPGQPSCCPKCGRILCSRI